MIFQSLHNKYKQSKKGGAPLWKLILYSFIKQFGFREFNILVHEIAALETIKETQQPSETEGISITLLNRKDPVEVARLETFIINETWHDNITFIHQRFEQNNHCFVCKARQCDTILGYIWLKQCAYVTYNNYTLPLGPNDAYTFDSIVSFAHRGKSILGSIYQYIFEWCYHNDIKRIYTIIDYDNYPSLRGNLKLGASEILKVSSLKLLKGRLWYSR
jgi:hypothetical protein